MAAVSQSAFECVRATDGGPPLTLTFPEGATQSFKKGDVVILTSGLLLVAGADPLAIVGVAAMDATGVTNSTILVWMASSNNIFAGNRGTVSGSTFTGTASVATDLGAVFGITRASTPTNKWAIDSSKTTNQTTNASTSRCQIVAFDPRDNLGDTGARLQFVFMDVVGATSITYARAFTGL